MKTLKEFIAISEFLGQDMTDEQATKLMDEAKDELSIAEIETLKHSCCNSFYTKITEYEGEIGGFERY